MHRVQLCLFVLLISLPGIVPVFAQNTGEMPPSVGILDDSLVYFDGNSKTIIYEHPNKSEYPNSLFGLSSIHWINEEEIIFRYQSSLWQIDIEGNLKQQYTLNQAMHNSLVTFSSDYRTAYYVQDANYSEYFFYMRRYSPVIAQNLKTGEQTTVGAILHTNNCDETYFTPMEYLYTQESGYNGNPVYFEKIDTGILYTSTCGGTDLSFLPLDATGLDNFPFSLDGIARVSLSPDGGKFAAMLTTDSGSLPFFIDLDNPSYTFLSLDQTYIDQFGWGPEGNLYFSTQVPAGDLARNVGFSLEAISTLEKELYSTSARDENNPVVPAYTVGIYCYDLETQKITEITVLDDAYGVGRFFVMNGEMAATVIPSGRAWLDAIATGVIEEPYRANDGSYVQPIIMQLTGLESPVVIATGITQFTPRD